MLSAGAYASCWGQGERTEEVFRQEFRLKSNDGPVKAVASYQIYAKGEVCESGSAGLVDGRKCAAHPYARRFFRTLSVIPQSGNPIEMGRTEKLVATAPMIERNGPCTDHAARLTNDFFASQISNAHAWRTEIEGDLVEVRRTLKLFGEIDDTTITLQR